jgi:hypothetical protein
MQYDLGLVGLGLLVLLSLAFGGLAQLVGRNRIRWQWVVAAVGFFIGGLIASEAIWADPTLDLEPIIDGLSVDEALLGGVIGGLIADIATRFATHTWPFGRRTTA